MATLGDQIVAVLRVNAGRARRDQIERAIPTARGYEIDRALCALRGGGVVTLTAGRWCLCEPPPAPRAA